jgi:hypothetical protein
MTMTPPRLELEGTWEEIITHAATLAGHRVRLTVLDPTPEATVAPSSGTLGHDPERAARLKRVRGKFARSGIKLASESL